MNNKFLSAPTVHFVAKRLVSPFWIRRRWLAQTQWLSADCLSDLQLDLLKKTVRYAEHNVPYYQKLMKSCGFSSRDIRSLEDIRLFPILTKKDIIDARRDMVSRAFARSLLRRECTGGTTGTPLWYRNYASTGMSTPSYGGSGTGPALVSVIDVHICAAASLSVPMLIARRFTGMTHP